jgi:hypothetical protein
MKHIVEFQELVTYRVAVEADSESDAVEIVRSGEFRGEYVIDREIYDEPKPINS